MSTEIAVREPYRYIQVWGEISRTPQAEIDATIELAREEGAPYDALYKRRHSGVWATFRTHMTKGYEVSNTYARIFAKNGWGSPVWSDIPTWARSIPTAPTMKEHRSE